VVKVVVLVETVDRSRNVNGRIADVVPRNLWNQTGSLHQNVMQQIGVLMPLKAKLQTLFFIHYLTSLGYTSGD
jgi:hypothetical protein